MSEFEQILLVSMFLDHRHRLTWAYPSRWMPVSCMFTLSTLLAFTATRVFIRHTLQLVFHLLLAKKSKLKLAREKPSAGVSGSTNCTSRCSKSREPALGCSRKRACAKGKWRR